MIPHLAIPLQTVGGAWGVVEQDTEAEVAQCVRNIVAFERGFRIEDPDFGIIDPTFTTMPIDTNDIVQAVAEYEQRAEIEVAQEVAPDGSVTVRLAVTVPSSEEGGLGT
jgi:phage baseplate assembly protein W